MIASERRRRVAHATLVFLSCIAIFSLGASRRAAWRTDEFRYLEVVREMALPGASLVVPKLAGEWYVHKPPGYFWAALALHRGLGLDFESAGKGASVVAASATVALVYGLAAGLGGAAMGIAAAAVLASAQLFASLAMRANLDAVLAALVAASLWAFARSELFPGVGARAAARLRVLAGACCGLALLVKGPVAIGIPAVVVLAFAWLRGRRVALRPWLPAVAALLLPGLVWLVFARLEAGPRYVSDLVLGHGVAHPLGMVGKLRPPWYYLEQLPVGFAPWSLMLPAAGLLAWRRRARSDGDAFVLAWALAPLVLLSLFPAKRHLYLLPAYPGIALLVGGWLAWSCEPDAEPHLNAATRALRVWSAVGCRATGALLLLAACAAVALHFSPERIPSWHLAEMERLATASMRAAALLSLVLAVGVGAALLGSRGLRAAWSGSLALASVTLLLLLGVVHPLQSAGTDSSGFYEEVARRIGSDPVAVLDGTDFEAEIRLPHTTIRRVSGPREALAGSARLAPHVGAIWLLGEEPHFERSSSRDAFDTVLRHESPLGKTLVLLRARDISPGDPRSESSSRRARRERSAD